MKTLIKLVLSFIKKLFFIQYNTFLFLNYRHSNRLNQYANLYDYKHYT